MGVYFYLILANADEDASLATFYVWPSRTRPYWYTQELSPPFLALLSSLLEAYQLPFFPLTEEERGLSRVHRCRNTRAFRFQLESLIMHTYV